MKGNQFIKPPASTAEAAMEGATTESSRAEKETHGSTFPLEQLYVYLTAGCNLACRHCWLSPKLQNETHTYPELPLELFDSILAQGKELGLKSVKLTGGEPLMHREITEIIKGIKARDLRLSIETNGTLCTPSLAESIAGSKDATAAVSLDGTDAGTHENIRGIKGAFDKAVGGIVNLVKAGLRPQIIMTVMRDNMGQMEAMIRLAEFLGASSLKFNVVQPTGRGKTLGTGGGTLRVEEILLLGKWVENIGAKHRRVRLHFGLPPAFRSLSRMYGPRGDGCSKCAIRNILGVLADGSYALCGIGSHIPELVFGNAGTDALAEVWNHAPVLKELRAGIPDRFEGICGRCHMKRACAGSCIAQNYYRGGSLFKPYWLCEEAYKKGLFPTSRITSKPPDAPADVMEA